MATELKGAVEARKALRKFAPDFAKELRKEMANLLKPIAKKGQGFIPSTVLSGWSKPASSDTEYKQFPRYDASKAKRGIGYRTSPSLPNNNGFRSLARIVNTSAAGMIYELGGVVNPQGRQPGKDKQNNKSLNPNAGKQFIDALDATGRIVDASGNNGGAPKSNKMKGRGMIKAWAQDGGKTNAAVLKAIQNSVDIYNRAMARVR